MNADVKQALDYLNETKIRATYTAMQSYLGYGVKKVDWNKILGPHRQYASWVVSKKTGMPMDYDAADLHPDLLKTPKMVTKGRQLKSAVADYAKQANVDSLENKPEPTVEPKAEVADCHGNNCAVICPSCKRPYVVSGFLNKGMRTCPHCGKSKANFKEAQKTWDLVHQDAIIESEQPATRLIFKKIWLGYDVWVTFTEYDVTYRYPHDQLLQTFISRLGIIENTKSWKTNGIYHFPRLSGDQKKMLLRYIVEIEPGTARGEKTGKTPESTGTPAISHITTTETDQ